ncbi:MAG: hypothetical protein ACT4PU_06465 [Planctomycetota bacterium]
MNTSLWMPVLWVYASQWLAGDVLVRWLWRDTPLLPVERIGRALLVGPAALAAQMIVMSLAGLSFSLTAVLVPWWVLAAVLLWRRASARGGGAAAGGASGAGRSSRAGGAAGVASGPYLSAAARWTGYALLGLTLLLFLALVRLGLQTPIFESDPLNNFALPARVFETERSLAPEVLGNLAAVGHVEYPPLVALNEALFFLAAGERRLAAPLPFFALAWLAFQLLLLGAALRRLHPAAVVPVVLISLAIPELYGLGTVGLAELRLAATVLLLGIEGTALLRQPSAAAGLRFAVVAALCALTKNEGVAIAALACLPLAALAWRRRLPRAAAVQGLLLVALVALGWVAILAAGGVGGGVWASDYVGEASLDPERLRAIFTGFLRYVPMDRLSSMYFGVLWPAAAAAALLGLVCAAAHRETAGLLLALAAHVLLYGFTLAIIPQHIEWTLQATGLRLFFHMVGWPLLLLVAAAAAYWPAQRPIGDGGVASGPSPRKSSMNCPS